jgi:hypothetical protein
MDWRPWDRRHPAGIRAQPKTPDGWFPRFRKPTQLAAVSAKPSPNVSRSTHAARCGRPSNHVFGRVGSEGGPTYCCLRSWQSTTRAAWPESSHALGARARIASLAPARLTLWAALRAGYHMRPHALMFAVNKHRNPLSPEQEIRTNHARRTMNRNLCPRRQPVMPCSRKSEIIASSVTRFPADRIADMTPSRLPSVPSCHPWSKYSEKTAFEAVMHFGGHLQERILAITKARAKCLCEIHTGRARNAGNRQKPPCPNGLG